ncbi:MAG: hypothetical protein LBJ39_01185 [Tannerellaceae bacterium]|jgi:hypothetical protein|nr:hypothetical protein [Tannerellaceae bacterium]
MNELSINRKNALAVYRGADSKGKELLERLFGAETFSSKVTDRVNTLEDAYEETGRPQCPEFDNVPEDWREYFKSLHDALVVTEALNEDWEADYNNGGQQKHYPYFHLSSSSGFAFDNAGCEYSYPHAGSAARLCLKSEELAKHMGEEFIKVYERIITK